MEPVLGGALEGPRVDDRGVAPVPGPAGVANVTGDGDRLAGIGLARRDRQALLGGAGNRGDIEVSHRVVAALVAVVGRGGSACIPGRLAVPGETEQDALELKLLHQPTVRWCRLDNQFYF